MKKIIVIFLLNVIAIYGSIIEVGVVISDLNNPFFKEVEKGLEARSRKSGVNLNIVDSANSIVDEFEAIEAYIKSGIDILIINPTDYYAASKGIKALNRAKIPVITMDRRSSGGEVISHIGSNNYLGGELLADHLIEKLGSESKIVEIEGTPDTGASEERSKGFNDKALGTLNVIVRKSGDFNRERSYEVMKQILEEEAIIDGVFAHNDLSALGVIDALEEAGRSALVVGFDGNKEARRCIGIGSLDATISQDPYIIGYMAMETAIKAAKGESVKEDIQIDIELVK